MGDNLSRRLFLSALLAGTAAAVGCRNGGNFTLLGYTTEPPFDPNIRSVYIPTFKLMPVVTSPSCRIASRRNARSPQWKSPTGALKNSRPARLSTGLPR